MITSSGEKQTVSQAALTAEKMFFWESITHLLVPVVPEVKSISAMASRLSTAGKV